MTVFLRVCRHTDCITPQFFLFSVKMSALFKTAFVFLEESAHPNFRQSSKGRSSAVNTSGDIKLSAILDRNIATEIDKWIDILDVLPVDRKCPLSRTLEFLPFISSLANCLSLKI